MSSVSVKEKIIVRKVKESRYIFATPKTGMFELSTLEAVKEYMKRHNYDYSVIEDRSQFDEDTNDIIDY